MLKNLNGTIETPVTQSYSNETELSDKEQLAVAPCGFDAWLQSYRQRLEELCQPKTIARSASAASSGR